MNRKAKGTAAERELIHAFHDLGWSAVRIAGSGSSRYPCPDLLAGNAQRRIAIECKSTAATRQYLTREEIDQLRQFAFTFGAEAWVAVRFPGKEWFFLLPEDLQETSKAFVVSKELAKLRGLQLHQLIAP